MGASEPVDPPAGMRHCPDWTPTMAVASKATICCRLPAVPQSLNRSLARSLPPARSLPLGCPPAVSLATIRCRLPAVPRLLARSLAPAVRWRMSIRRALQTIGRRHSASASRAENRLSIGSLSIPRSLRLPLCLPPLSYTYPNTQTYIQTYSSSLSLHPSLLSPPNHLSSSLPPSLATTLMPDPYPPFPSISYATFNIYLAV